MFVLGYQNQINSKQNIPRASVPSQNSTHQILAQSVMLHKFFSLVLFLFCLILCRLLCLSTFHPFKLMYSANSIIYTINTSAKLVSIQCQSQLISDKCSINFMLTCTPNASMPIDVHNAKICYVIATRFSFKIKQIICYITIAFKQQNICQNG